MTTNMQRLQVSLPKWQIQLLRRRAREQGVSMAEIVRQLVQREAEQGGQVSDDAGLWAIAGIADDPHPLIHVVPVSESPELYLTAAPTDLTSQTAPSRRKRRRSDVSHSD